MISAWVLFVALGAASVEVTLFAPADSELTTAIAAQLTDLEVELTVAAEQGGWASTEAGQLRQVRALLLGRPTRVAIWVDANAKRVHVADVWSGQHVERDLALDSGGREAAALMVRSAVASFVEQDVSPPSEVLSASEQRFRVMASWHATKWGATAPWVAHGPLIEASWAFASPLAVWLWGRFEMPVSVATEQVSLQLQRNDVAAGVELALTFGPRVSLRPKLGLAMRLISVRTQVTSGALEATAPGVDVGLAPMIGVGLSVHLVGPLEAVAQGWAAVPVITPRYRVQGETESTTAFTPSPVEAGASIGVALRY